MEQKEKKQSKVLQNQYLSLKLILLLNIYNSRNVEVLTASVLNDLGFKTYNGSPWNKGSISTIKKAFFDKKDKRTLMGNHINILTEFKPPVAIEDLPDIVTDIDGVLSKYLTEWNIIKHHYVLSKELLNKGIDYEWIVKEYNQLYSSIDNTTSYRDLDYFLNCKFDIENPVKTFQKILYQHLKILSHITGNASNIRTVSDFRKHYEDMMFLTKSNWNIDYRLLKDESPEMYSVISDFLNQNNKNKTKTISLLEKEWLSLPVTYINEYGNLIQGEDIRKVRISLQNNVIDKKLPDRIDTLTPEDSSLKGEESLTEPITDSINDYTSGEDFLQKVDALTDEIEEDIIPVEDPIYNMGEVDISLESLYLSIIKMINYRVNNPSEVYKEYLSLVQESHIAKGLLDQYNQYHKTLLLDGNSDELHSLTSQIQNYVKKFNSLGLGKSFEVSVISEKDKYAVAISEEQEWNDINIFKGVPFSEVDTEYFNENICKKIITKYETSVEKNIQAKFLNDLFELCNEFNNRVINKNNYQQEQLENVPVDKDVVIEDSNTTSLIKEPYDDSLPYDDFSLNKENTQILYTLEQQMKRPSLVYTALLTSKLDSLLERFWLLECSNFALHLCARLYSQTMALSLNSSIYSELASSPQILKGFVVNEIYKMLKNDYPDDSAFSKFKDKDRESGLFQLYEKEGKVGIALNKLEGYFQHIWDLTNSSDGLEKIFSLIRIYKLECKNKYEFGNDKYYYELEFKNFIVNNPDKKQNW